MRILSVTSIRNEGPFLLEWIAHHRGAGVTDFLIHSNDCDDGSDALLDALQAAGVVTHLPQSVPEGESPQWLALRAAWKHPLRKACDWALVSDVDEYLNIHVGDGTLAALFAALPPWVDGVVLPWRLFGNAGVIRFQDLPVTEQFVASAPADTWYPVAATLFKSLIRLAGPFNQFGVHRPRQKSAPAAPVPRWVDGSGHEMPSAFAANPQRLSLLGLPAGRGLVECNHYSLRAAESFMVKRARGLPNRSEKQIDLGYWVERNFNAEVNRSIARMRAATLREWDRLIALPGIRALHDASVAHHRQRFLDLMRQRSEQRLFGQIAIAGDSRMPDPASARQILEWYQAIVAADR